MLFQFLKKECYFNSFFIYMYYMYINIFILVFLLSITFVFLFMYKRGAYYQNHISHCGKLPKRITSTSTSDSFCGISTFDYTLPCDIRNSLTNISNSDIAKRVNVYQWKAGKTVSTQQLLKYDSKIINWYIDFANEVSKIIGEPVKHTSLDLPTSCVLLIYDEKDDFINWHFDQNHFEGRFFTVLIPISEDITCTKYLFKDANEEIQTIDHNEGNIIFEGSKVFHMASKLCDNQKRVVLSLQYVTDDNISLYNSLLMKIKDMAYTGF